MGGFPDSSTTNPIREDIIKKYSSKSHNILIGALLAVILNCWGTDIFLKNKAYSIYKNNKQVIEYNLMSQTYKELQNKKEKLESQITNILPYKPKNLEDDSKIIFKEENLEKKLALDRVIKSIKIDMENKEKDPAYQEAIKMANEYSRYGERIFLYGSLFSIISGFWLLKRNSSKREKELKSI